MPERFTYDPLTRRYRTPVGVPVPQLAVDRAVDRMADQVGADLRASAERLVAGDLTLAQWQTAAMSEIKAAHLAATAAGRGGFAQMTQAEYGWAGQRIRTQYDYLRQFAAQIADGRQPLDGTLVARAELYGQAARATQREQERREARQDGDTLERNLLGPADHCDGCLEATALGWQPLGTLPAIGNRDCLARCRCSFETAGGVEAVA